MHHPDLKPTIHRALIRCTTFEDYSRIELRRTVDMPGCGALMTNVVHCDLGRCEMEDAITVLSSTHYYSLLGLRGTILRERKAAALLALVGHHRVATRRGACPAVVHLRRSNTPCALPIRGVARRFARCDVLGVLRHDTPGLVIVITM